jgi:hypothetical protein
MIENAKIWPLSTIYVTFTTLRSHPSDTYLRVRLDEVDPDTIRPAFKKLFASFQREKGVEEFEYLDRHVLISVDGTGIFHLIMSPVHIAVRKKAAMVSFHIIIKCWVHASCILTKKM